VTHKRATRPLPEELRRLIDEHGVSLRALAEAIGVNQSYLSRILGAKSSRPASARVAAEIAEYFELPTDYFGEYREAVVIEAVAADPKLRDRVYDSLKRRG
jgi:transcriptional regulator with XRE-family HTH domain